MLPPPLPVLPPWAALVAAPPIEAAALPRLPAPALAALLAMTLQGASAGLQQDVVAASAKPLRAAP
jgi:hypothetical protein